MKRTTITFAPRVSLTFVSPLLSPPSAALLILFLHWLGFL